MEFSNVSDNNMYVLSTSGQIFQLTWKRPTPSSVKYHIKPIIQNKVVTCFSLHPTQPFLLAYSVENGEIFIKTSEESNKTKTYILSNNNTTTDEGKKVKDLKWFVFVGYIL
jgi:hypothetical protein